MEERFSYWCQDSFMMSANDLSVQVRAVPHGENTSVDIIITIYRDKKWFQLVLDEIVLHDLDSGEQRTVKVHRGRQDYDEGGILDRIDKGSQPYKSVDIYVEIPHFRPKAFIMEIPSLIVDGIRVDFTPIHFEHRRGLRLYMFGQ